MEKIRRKILSVDESDTVNPNVNADSLNMYGLQGLVLWDYQLEGVKWLAQRYHRNHGCILGDEMGLGKTCQTISFLVYLHGSGQSRGPHLILSPLSVLGNWQNELSSFSPGLEVINYVGDKDTRERLRINLRKNINEVTIVLTTYELCLKDEHFLRRFSWHTLVVDEAHRLKNRQSLLHQVLLEFDFNHRMLLTGTPVQNNLKELFALLCFVAPNIYKERHIEYLADRFKENYSLDKSNTDMKELHEILQPFLLRRIKAEVIKDLPNKIEVVLHHNLSTLQKKYYRAILAKDMSVFTNDNHQGNKTRLMNILMQLRKCVNHPYLFDGVEPEPFVLGEHLVEASGKLLLLDQLLTHLKDNGHRVLIFSQMTRMLDIVQDYLGYRGYSYERLDGSVRGEERFLAIRNFNADDETFIFILSTKAGGQGLNLVGADTVIFLDSDYNPQNDLQAAARAHRIGQTRPVRVIRLIAQRTIEEIILRRAAAKLKLTDDVIEGGQFSLGTDNSSSDTDYSDIKLQDILKFGIDNLLSEDDNTAESLNFVNLLGVTENSAWSSEGPISDVNASASLDMDVSADTEGSMYVFEGHDYKFKLNSKDEAAFDKLVNAEEMTKHEIENGAGSTSRRERRKKRDIAFGDWCPPNEEELERLRNERQKAREQKAKERKCKIWHENGYTSCNIELTSDDEDEIEDELNEGKDVEYVVGDVTCPKVDKNNKHDCIIIHCVDNSGSWGRGGLFSALTRRSGLPEEKYELAKEMKDLSLGDCHLITLNDKSKDTIDDNDIHEGVNHVGLIIAQARDKNNVLSGIKLPALAHALKRIYKAAKKLSASVHLPRIGYSMPGFNWYGTERLIRKHLASKGIETLIYYYPRKPVLKRKATSPLTNQNNRQKINLTRVSDDLSSGSSNEDDMIDPIPSTSNKLLRPSSPITQETGDTTGNDGFLANVCIHLHNFSEDDVSHYTRLIVRAEGDCHPTVEDSTTHIVVSSSTDLQDREKLREYNDFFEEAHIVNMAWLADSVKQKKLLAVSPYLLVIW